MSPIHHAVYRLAGAMLLLLIAMVSPAIVVAHAELETATPADGATVPGPFVGPIVLTFSANLAEGSKADLLDTGGGEILSAVVDGPGATMTITLLTPLGPAGYEVRWVSVGEDGDIERGTVSFTVAPPPPTPTPEPTPEPTASAAPTAEPTPSAAPVAPSAAPSAITTTTPADGTPGSGPGDVVIPIVVALLIVALGGGYLLGRRGRPDL